MSAPTPETRSAARRALDDLAASRLAPTAWAALAGDLARLDVAVASGDDEAVRAALVPLTQAAFEGKVRRRLASAGSQAPVVAPTKRASALPAVGVGCAALLLVLGYQLGGGLVFAGTVVLAVMVVAVALAGMRSRRAGSVPERPLTPMAEPTEPAPLAVRDVIAELRAKLADP